MGSLACPGFSFVPDGIERLRIVEYRNRDAKNANENEVTVSLFEKVTRVISERLERRYSEVCRGADDVAAEPLPFVPKPKKSRKSGSSTSSG